MCMYSIYNIQSYIYSIKKSVEEEEEEEEEEEKKKKKVIFTYDIERSSSSFTPSVYWLDACFSV